jgi:hypothetical protein
LEHRKGTLEQFAARIAGGITNEISSFGQFLVFFAVHSLGYGKSDDTIG